MDTATPPPGLEGHVHLPHLGLGDGRAVETAPGQHAMPALAPTWSTLPPLPALALPRGQLAAMRGKQFVRAERGMLGASLSPSASPLVICNHGNNVKSCTSTYFGL